VGACHCGMCRKWGGGPLLAVESVGDIRFEGKEHITLYASSDWAERGFCARCGTHLFYRLRGQHHYAFPAGFLTDTAGLTFTSQIFIDEKPDFYAFANQTRDLTGAEAFAEFGAS
ncbi:MAG: GFA family protein, partial [Sphingomonadales bacterium]